MAAPTRSLRSSAPSRASPASTAPPNWRRGPDSLLEAFPAGDGSAPGTAATIDRVKIALAGGDGTLTGVAAVDQEFLHTLYANFPYLLAFVLVLTLLLLARAFRSIVLALKAVLLNLVSLAAAFGIVVFVFQQGHGSAIWSIGATQSISPWLPLMIFAFLYGLSMDYEVFMLTRIREAYDQTGSTEKAIELGLARTGKLVTSAAFILMFAFLLLSTSPGYESKEFAIALAGGIIFDATVIRALLVPALMRLLGNANWWMPSWTRTILLLRPPASQGCTQNSPTEKPDQPQTAESIRRLRSSPSRVLRAFGFAGPGLFAKTRRPAPPRERSLRQPVAMSTFTMRARDVETLIRSQRPAQLAT